MKAFGGGADRLVQAARSPLDNPIASSVVRIS